MKLLQNILIIFALLTNFVFAIDITENRVDRGFVTLSFGEIIIHPSASWSIIDNSFSNFIGKLDVKSKAGLYISLTSHLLALQVSLTSLLHSINNSGVISFDSRVSLTPSSYDLRGLSFTNSGEMYFAASGRVPSTMSLTSALWTNTGLLLFYQNQRTSGAVCLGFPLGSITNSGKICLNNQVYQQTTQIKGSGCFAANGDSTIYIANVLLSVSANQNFHLVDKDSSMIVQAISTTQTFNVYGFGNGNKIGLTLPLIGNIFNSAYSYDSSTGILTLRNILLEQNFNIGLGYDSNKFQVVTDSGSGIPSTIWGSVTYTGRVPTRTLPKSCQIACKPIPEAPGVNPTDYTTTITKTNTAGNTITETGAVTILTDKSGSWFTTTSLFPTLATTTSTSISTTLSNVTPIKTTDNTLVEPLSTGDYISAPISSSDFISLESLVEQTLSNESPVSSSAYYVSQESLAPSDASASDNSLFASESTLKTASGFLIAESSVTESYLQSADSGFFEISTSSAIENSYISTPSSAEKSFFSEETHMSQASSTIDSYTYTSGLSSTTGSESYVTELSQFSEVSLVTASESFITNELVGTESSNSGISLVSASVSTDLIGEPSISGDTLFESARQTEFIKSSFSGDLVSESASGSFISSYVSNAKTRDISSDSFIASQFSVDESSYTSEMASERTIESFVQTSLYSIDFASETASESSSSMVVPSASTELLFETSSESIIAQSYISNDVPLESASQSFIVKPSYSEIAFESANESISSTIEVPLSSEIISEATGESIITQPSVSSGISLETTSESMLFSDSSISTLFISSQTFHETTSDSILVVPSFFTSEVPFETDIYSSIVSTSLGSELVYSSKISLETPSESFIASENDVKEPSYSNEIILETPSTSFIASETYTVQSFVSGEVSFESDRESTTSAKAILGELSVTGDLLSEITKESLVAQESVASESMILSETIIVEPSIFSDLLFETTSQPTEIASSTTSGLYVSSTEELLASSDSAVDESSFAANSISATQAISLPVASESFVLTDSITFSETSSRYITISTFAPASDNSEKEFKTTWETANFDGSSVTESSILPTTVITSSPSATNDVDNEITSTWNSISSDSSVATESDIVDQYTSHSTTSTSHPASKSLSDRIETDFISTWTITGSLSDDSSSTTKPTPFSEFSNSDITTAVVSTWAAENSNLFTLVKSSTHLYVSGNFISSTATIVSIAEPILTSDVANTEYHSIGDVTKSTGSVSNQKAATTHYEGGFTSESDIYTVVAPGESIQEFGTATITSCFESKCSESIVTYISNISHSTVTTGYVNSVSTTDTYANDFSATGDYVASGLSRSAMEVTNSFATNTDIFSTSTALSQSDLFYSNSYISTVTTGPITSSGSSQAIETGLSFVTTIRYENGSTNISTKHFKFMGIVVSILILFV